MAEWQLREYQIEHGRLADFVAAWTDGVLPLRRAAGFDVQAWTIEADSTFVWILGYRGPGSFEDADGAYYASPARTALDPDPALPWLAAGAAALIALGAVAGQLVRRRRAGAPRA